MNGIPWSATEHHQLEQLVGDAPMRVVHYRYNRWAKEHGYIKRSLEAIGSRAKRAKLSLRAYGEMISANAVARVLGISEQRVPRWARLGLIEHKLLTFTYVTRSELRRLAQQRPELFAGIKRQRLYQLLEDEELAATIARNYPRNSSAAKRVRCVETGRVFRSILEAAAHVYVHRRAITIATTTGGTSAGYHWELLA